MRQKVSQIAILINGNEPIIRTAFRVIVILLFVACLVKIDEAIDTAEGAYSMAYDANMSAESAASNAKDASYSAEICRELRFK